ncbi:MAG TPA: TIR domain-containing protein [Rhizomicrobium sp.]|jgi:hypothetical protein|nr:TIR domain-containing protein [Rhizomicrobium sp.]
MADDAAGAKPRYWAFISYCHKDADFGRRLHRRLESYSLPRRMVGRSTGQGSVPRRLAPIFRDREELPAATDLSTEVRAALAQSRSLIVVCSPDASASLWVSREVELFRALHPDLPILAAIREGEPAQCFPETLIGTGPAGTRIEPLAADFRPGRDGTQLGLLKLVAGITGLGLDELVQRDAQRNRRRVTAITAGALLAMAIMGVLTAVAVQARREAERQRAEAEGLVEFMLTDLRERLKGVGRLDVMTAVNERALEHYKGQNLTSLSVDSLERRARILHAMGEDDESRGDHMDALLKFREAERTTAALLMVAPNDPERVFDQAQSVYWLGEAAFQQGRLPDARKQFLAYRDLAARMITLEPTSIKYKLELDYAESNLCSLAIGPSANPGAALTHCGAALAQIKKIAQESGKNGKNNLTEEYIDDLVKNCHANMADAYLRNNNVAAALAERESEEEQLKKEMAADPKNKDLDDEWMILQRALAQIEVRKGVPEAARKRLERTLALASQMMLYDPGNKMWARTRKKVVDDLNKLQHK